MSSPRCYQVPARRGPQVIPKSISPSLLVASLLLGTVAEAQTTATSNRGARPNIVFILADDMGYGDLKAYNPESKILTPHLDKLATDGMVFTDAHSGGSTCVPSRYSLITGRFAARRNKLNWRGGPVIARGQLTFASVLREQGYRTAMVGKWHLGFTMKSPGVFDYSKPLAGGPVDCGFDSYFGMPASLDIPPYFYISDRTPTMAPTESVAARDSVGGKEGWNRIQGAFWRAGKLGPDFKHAEVTPKFSAEAVKVIQSHDGKRPLFLYLALPSPHTPWLPTKEFIGKSTAGMYGDFVMQVDHVVGHLLDGLKRADMSDNTLVIFSSDNGPVWYDKDIDRFGHRSVGPLRGIKGSAWEGGHRVPFIAHWPGRIKAGSRSDHTIAFADALATFANAAGRGELPEDMAEDSVSFLPVLLHPDRQHKSRPPILHSDKVIRDGDWKLIATKANRGFGADRKVKYGTELYNLKDDLSEKNNLADEMPEKVEHLRAKMRRILDN